LSRVLQGGGIVESTTRKQSSRMKRGRKNLELVGMGQMEKGSSGEQNKKLKTKNQYH
jgi:hypothetical protein